jgi:hypothetical protein
MEQERPAPLCPNHPTVIMSRVATFERYGVSTFERYWFICTQRQSPEVPRTCGNSLGA